MARLSLVLILLAAIVQPAAAAATHHRARRHLATTATRVKSASSSSSAHSAKSAKARKTRTPRGPRWAANEPSNALDVELKISPPRRDPPPSEMATPAPSATTPPAAPSPPSATTSSTALGSSPPPGSPPPVATLDLPPPPSGPAPPPAMLDLRSPTAPPVDDARRERRWGLFAGGAALFLGGYALDVGLSYGIDHKGAGTSLIPLVGPFIQMGESWSVVAPTNSGNAQVDAEANSRIASVNHTVQVAAYCVLAVDVAMQLAGATMAVVGLIGQRPSRSYASTRRTLAWSLSPSPNGLAVRF